jgi:signal transduction histidine kinase
MLVQHAADGTTSAFLPHGYCYLWDRPLLLTHVISDALIGLSYVVISCALVLLVHRARKDIPFHVLFVAFGLFIIACGLTHFMEIWTLWHPSYWAAGGLKAVTAVASVTTAAVMPSAVPRVLTTIRDAALSRDREIAAARSAALEEQNALLATQAAMLAAQNELLQAQTLELEQQTEEAQSLAQELERSNRELRRALADADGARRAAEAANRAKGDFLAVMSHELRTPLNAVGGYAQLMEMGVPDPVTPTQHEYLEQIQRSQRHLLGLINQILNFTRIEAGELRFDVAELQLRNVLRDAETLIAPQFAAKGLHVNAMPCADGLTARADAEKLRQILLNLLSNAVKFTPAGGTITLACARVGDRVHVEVRDTGPGIPADQLERVFDPFVQLAPPLTRTHEGIGLGLAISRDLARGMGAELTLASTPGVGSTFTVSLPHGGG